MSYHRSIEPHRALTDTTSVRKSPREATIKALVRAAEAGEVERLKGEALNAGSVWICPDKGEWIWAGPELMSIEHDGHGWQARWQGDDRLSIDWLTAQLEPSRPRKLDQGSGVHPSRTERILQEMSVIHDRLRRFIKLPPDVSLPLAFFGVRFGREGIGSETCWRGWPQAFMSVPAWLVWKTDTREEYRLLSLGQPPLVTAQESTIAEKRSVSPETVTENEPIEDWVGRVDSALQTIAEGRASKLVLARSISIGSGDDTQLDVPSTVQQMETLPDSNTRFVFNRSGETFLGSTPETLVEVYEERLSTHALAGTIETHDDEALGDPKIRAEHQLVIDQILSDLRDVVDDISVCERPNLKPAGALFHLESSISGRLREGADLFTAVAALHPTPALAGSPRAFALRWLEETEPMDRGFYGAPIGWVNADGHGRCCVAIRSLLANHSTIRLFAGAGIVPGSNPRDEWQETQLKLTTMLSRATLTSREKSS